MINRINDKAIDQTAEQLLATGFKESHLDRIARASFLIVGSTSLAMACAGVLVASGARRITIVDKSLAALTRLSDSFLQNTSMQSKEQIVRFQLLQNLDDSDNALAKLAAQADLVLDCSADWQDKLSLSDLCMELHRPLVHQAGHALRFHLYSMMPGQSACLRCLMERLGIEDAIQDPSSEYYFVPAIGLLASAMVLAATKIVSRYGVNQANEIFCFDALSGESEVLRGFDPSSDCPDCGRLNR